MDSVSLGLVTDQKAYITDRQTQLNGVEKNTKKKLKRDTEKKKNAGAL